MGNVKPLGVPLRAGSWDNDKCVLAIQIGKLLKPCKCHNYKCKHYSSKTQRQLSTFATKTLKGHRKSPSTRRVKQY
jgi:hypothetical protein